MGLVVSLGTFLELEDGFNASAQCSGSFPAVFPQCWQIFVFVSHFIHCQAINDSSGDAESESCAKRMITLLGTAPVVRYM